MYKNESESIKTKHQMLKNTSEREIKNHLDIRVEIISTKNISNKLRIFPH